MFFFCCGNVGSGRSPSSRSRIAFGGMWSQRSCRPGDAFHKSSQRENSQLRHSRGVRVCVKQGEELAWNCLIRNSKAGWNIWNIHESLLKSAFHDFCHLVRLNLFFQRTKLLLFFQRGCNTICYVFSCGEEQKTFKKREKEIKWWWRRYLFRVQSTHLSFALNWKSRGRNRAMRGEMQRIYMEI